VHRHVANEITLLCDRHHREKTAGLLPIQQVREANQNPHNKQTGVSRPYDRHFSGESCEFAIGGNICTISSLHAIPELIAVAIENPPLFGFMFDQGHLFLNLLVSDRNGQPILLIYRNQLRCSTIPWDIELTGKRLVIREGAGHVLIDILFSPPNRVEVRRWLCNASDRNEGFALQSPTEKTSGRCPSSLPSF
jgi:trigger factor